MVAGNFNLGRIMNCRETAGYDAGRMKLSPADGLLVGNIFIGGFTSQYIDQRLIQFRIFFRYLKLRGIQKR